MNSRMDEDLATNILAAIDEFSQPINRLDVDLRKIGDDETRRRLLRHLGDLMGLLDGEIGFEARRALRQVD
jgi:hypothetical protein